MVKQIEAMLGVHSHNNTLLCLTCFWPISLFKPEIILFHVDLLMAQVTLLAY